ncbi:CDP-alcohol phosphatidyltransferase family protein [Agriterribacter sp.]|uniref:CDP-alcohol phosphatidyltransferase family protein n=1 Tax=Agriterribacter sp. TaxID=2821509 RepID=UPI002BAC2222|nr:CDP-alcohol phosphatidyltransferase family protein [Agriterribacter sp.]HTN07458.1 CDP-alcohol phosphatidyltransferase family protein [Agriterribacter sp.]
MKHIPNLFTLLNLVFGCLAIIVILQSGIGLVTTGDGVQMMNMPEQIFLASLFIALAAVVDFFDGFVARLMKTTSGMGKQLDSLADVVSFGVAPALIIYQFLRLSVAREENGLDASFAWLLPALLLPCAAAWRLARFNLDETQTYHFKGVPVPAVGLLVASFPLIFWHSSVAAVTGIFLNKWIWYAVVLLLSWLMVSNMPVMSLKFKDYSFKNNVSKWILVILAISLVVLFRWTAVPLIFIAYILLSLPLKNKIAS